MSGEWRVASGEWRVASGEWRRHVFRMFGAPLRAGFRRAVVEGIVGYSVLLALALATDAAYRTGGRNSGLEVLGWMWLILWPAWRLRAMRGGFWSRMGKGSARAVLCGFLLGVSAVVSWHVLWLLIAHVAPAPAVWAGAPVGVTFFFLGARTLVVTLAALYRRARRRLRWQLTASYLAVIMLTFAAMTAVGSVAGLAVFLKGANPKPDVMAASVADALTTADRAAPLQRVGDVLGGIQAGRVALRGEQPFAALRPSPNTVAPRRILVMRPNGTIVGAVMDKKLGVDLRIARATAPLPRQLWMKLRAQALAGHTATVGMGVDAPVNRGAPFTTQAVVGAAPVVDARGHPVAVAMVEVSGVNLQSNSLVPTLLAVFGVSTFLVILATGLPVLLLSSLFGFLLARGLTRRLEAVSRVTTAIAGGDLSQRVHVRAVDESGRLAASVNSMAANMETAMAELRRARMQAEEALRARQELVASISHELRTPLAIVRAHLDNLALRQPVAAGSVVDERVYGDEREVVLTEPTLRALRHETERLAVLVDDLFTLSRAETGTLQVHCEPVDVAALVDEVAALMRPLAQSEGQIALTVDARLGLPYALADAGRLRQILENLVRNAVRHTPDGGIIALSVTAGEDGVVMAVADTGEGMAPEHLARIFDRFYRVDQSRTRELGGAGLGLAIVREFVELMGGRVTVESTLGEGSCFRVFLPLAR